MSSTPRENELENWMPVRLSSARFDVKTRKAGQKQDGEIHLQTRLRWWLRRWRAGRRRMAHPPIGGMHRGRLAHQTPT
jgi:hypothetical protein